MRAVANLVRLGLGKDGSSGQAESVLEPDQSGLRTIIGRRRDLLFDLRPGQRAVFTVNHPRLASRKCSYGCRLQIDEMSTLFADDLLAVMRMALHGDLVAHSPSGHEDGRFALEDPRGKLLQAIDGGIFAVNIIADLGFGHGL